MHADPAARVRPCHAARLSSAPAARMAATLRPVVHQVSRVVPAESGQQEIRPAPASLVRAKPPRRGLRRDLRRLAGAAFRLAAALRWLARLPEVAVCRPFDEGTRRGKAPGDYTYRRRSGAHAHPHVV